MKIKETALAIMRVLATRTGGFMVQRGSGRFRQVWRVRACPPVKTRSGCLWRRLDCGPAGWPRSLSPTVVEIVLRDWSPDRTHRMDPALRRTCSSVGFSIAGLIAELLDFDFERERFDFKRERRPAPALTPAPEPHRPLPGPGWPGAPARTPTPSVTQKFLGP